MFLTPALALVATLLLGAPGAAAQVRLPLPAPQLPEEIRAPGRESAETAGLPLGSPQRMLVRLNETFRLGLEEPALRDMSRRLEEELYPRLGWKTADIPALLAEINTHLGLGIDPTALAEFGAETVRLQRAAPWEDHPSPPKSAGEPSFQSWQDHTSRTLTGSTLVVLVLVNVPGEAAWNDVFPSYRISWANYRADLGMKLFQDEAPGGAGISREVRYYVSSVSVRPSANRECFTAWMTEALAEHGFGDWDGSGNLVDDASRYLREYYGRDNCLVVFVPKEQGRSYACRWDQTSVGVVFFDMDFIFDTDWQTYAHEMGHMFGACDEYYQSSDDTGCDFDDPWNQSGEGCDDPCKLTFPTFQSWAQNSNCEKCNPDAADCLMATPDLWHWLFGPDLCGATRTQFGWRDHDGDGILDGRDANPAVAGPACNNGAPETTPPASAVSSLAALTTAGTTFPVSWAGTDACGGVQHFDVQYRVGAGPWTDWQVDVSGTGAQFAGEDWHTYYFRSRAQDGFGNLEPWPGAGGDAHTTVMVGPPPVPTVASSTHPDPGRWVANDSPSFEWTSALTSDRPLSELITGYSFVLDRSATTVPDEIPEGSDPAGSFAGLADGAWWFHVRSRSAAGVWGSTAHRQVRIDTHAPVLAALADPEVLWPPNHKLVPVSIRVTCTDASDPEPEFTLVSATCDEPAGDKGHADDDIRGVEAGTPDTGLLLRAERLGTGPGRIYSIVYRATDQAGNSTQSTCYVQVPHDLGKAIARGVPAPPDAAPAQVGEAVVHELSLGMPKPNPAARSLGVTFTLPAEEAVSLLVFDIQGRVVRNLAGGVMPAGPHTATWDGRDEAGRQVGGGIYLLGLRAGGPMLVRRFVLLP